MFFRMQNSIQITILPSTLIQLNGIDKLWTFEVEESKLPKRHEHTLKNFLVPARLLLQQHNSLHTYVLLLEPSVLSPRAVTDTHPAPLSAIAFIFTMTQLTMLRLPLCEPSVDTSLALCICSARSVGRYCHGLDRQGQRSSLASWG